MNVVSIGVCVRNKLPNPLPTQLLYTLLQHRFFCSYKRRHATQAKALKILDIIAPKTGTAATDRRSHLRLIQDFLRTTSYQVLSCDFTSSNGSGQGFWYVLDEILEPSFLNDKKFGTLCLGFDASSLSSGVSSCASLRDLRGGIQYHCLAITTGFLANAYVGCSLITLYSRCRELESAYKVFYGMPVRNVVTWTAIISGFAQECQVDVCLELFSVMRNSTLKPNDFTFTSLLSACTGSGVLGQGRSAHSQIIQMGFHAYLHIANTLISMYSKCGSVQDALYIFENMISKDIVSWNSMLSGYAQHGLAMQAIELFEKMKKQGVKPDSITFLGVLSSCRHAGLVEGGRNYFNSMIEYGVKAEVDHYSCLVDLLGRAGLIEEALHLILRMPLPPNAVIWGSLLSSCRLHGSASIGITAAESRLLLEPDCAATHVQLANLYASVGWWDQAARMRKLMKDGALKTSPGFSWIEIKNKVYRFRAQDGSNTRVGEILNVLDYLVDHMITLENVCEVHKQEIIAFQES